jgi:hypothetical protein
MDRRKAETQGRARKGSPFFIGAAGGMAATLRYPAAPLGPLPNRS